MWSESVQWRRYCKTSLKGSELQLPKGELNITHLNKYASVPQFPNHLAFLIKMKQAENIAMTFGYNECSYVCEVSRMTRDSETYNFSIM
jgi:hypothetical protein